MKYNDEIEELKLIKLKYETLLKTIPCMAWFMNVDGLYEDINEQFNIHSGKSIEDIKGKNHKKVWECKIGNECNQNDLETLKSSSTKKFEEIVPGKKGYRKLNIYRTAVRDEKGNVLGIVAVGQDITELKNKEAHIRMIIENLPFEVWQYDINENIVIANEKFAKYANLPMDQIIGKNIKDIFSEDKVQELIAENKIVLETKQPIKTIRKIRKGNVESTVEVYKTPILNIANEIIGIVGILVDITEMNEAKRKIRLQAYTDYDTNLLNRRALYFVINNELKRKPKTAIIMDVDNFKHINDVYGHNGGDRILSQIAQKLKSINKDDYVFRFGGDEFIVIFKEIISEEDIKMRAKLILNEISKIKIENETVSVSIGIASCMCNCNSCNCKTCGDCRLIVMADIALYKAKENGRNRFEIYTKELEEELVFKKDLENDLSKAIEKNEVTLFYQPQYTSNEKIIGFEALFRWKNEKYKEISIGEIINVMEKTNLIVDVGKEIMRQACIFAKKINKNSKEEIIISFNVSAVQIMSDGFISSVKKILKDTDVNAKYLAMEITENIMLEDMDKSIKIMNELKDIGISIILDDFGTGYSSFNYLVKLPLSEVKIDKSFSMEMEKHEDYRRLIKLIVDASHSLNFVVVAEGVETKEQLKIFKDMGVEYMQGYLFSKPVNEEEAYKLLK